MLNRVPSLLLFLLIIWGDFGGGFQTPRTFIDVLNTKMLMGRSAPFTTALPV